MKDPIKIIAAAVMLVILNICTISGYYAVSLPDSYYVEKGGNFEISSAFPISTCETDAVPSMAQADNCFGRTVSLRLFGIVPVKEVQVKPVDRVMLIPSGEPFGIKLLIEGVMIVGTGKVKTCSGMECPAEECGLEKGDIILSADGRRIGSNADIQRIVSDSEGRPFDIVYIHDSTRHKTTLTPAVCENDDSYKAGLWVRDSTAGIGTVTFTEPSTNRFGGLGHPVCDSDTGEIVPISGGEMTNVRISDVLKGRSGAPGELHGNFSSKLSSGVIYKNNACGVFGERFESLPCAQAIPMALKQEVQEGPATIRATIDSGSPKDYTVEIEEIDWGNEEYKNMLIRVTDEELLSKTGGIVQGMSGSPIIQNGKLVGAVTHVLINDPERGFGIFCENMYREGLSGHTEI